MKTDRRVLLSGDLVEALERMYEMSAVKNGWIAKHEREKLGMGIEALFEEYSRLLLLAVEVDDRTRERISTMISNGVCKTQEGAVAEAVELLFNQKKEEIMQKIASL